MPYSALKLCDLATMVTLVEYNLVHSFTPCSFTILLLFFFCCHVGRTILQHFSVQLVEEQAHRPTLPFAPNEESGVDNALSGKQRGEKRLWGSDYQYDPDHRQHDNDSDSGSKHDLEEGSSEEEVECAPHVETQAIASSAVPLTAHSQLSSPCSSNVATGGQQGQRQDSRQQIRVLLCEACEAPLAKEAGEGG